MIKKIVYLAVIGLAFYIGFTMGIGNQELKYGESTGTPKNCRALITENLVGFKSGKYTAEAALSSIDRNCGEFGYVWNER